MVIKCRMEKKVLYVARTDYDWTKHIATMDPKLRKRFTEEDPRFSDPSYDIVGDLDDFELYGGRDLERKIRKHKNGSLKPSIELRRNLAVVHFSSTRAIQLDNITPEYTLLVDLIFFRRPDFCNDFFRSRLPSNFGYFDLVFDFVSNNGLYDAALSELDKEFEVRRIGIYRGDEE